MGIFLYKLYGTIAVAAIVIIFIIYSKIRKGLKRESLMEDYRLRIQNMTDDQLKDEKQLLACKLKHQSDVDDDILGANPSSDIDQMYKIALTEFNRRKLVS